MDNGTKHIIEQVIAKLDPEVTIEEITQETGDTYVIRGSRDSSLYLKTLHLSDIQQIWSIINPHA